MTMEHCSTVSCMCTGTGNDQIFTIIAGSFLPTDINLQNLCLEKLSNWLKSTSDIDTLPLPTKLRVQLKTSFIW